MSTTDPIFLELERKFISHILKIPNDCYLIVEEYLTNFEFKSIYKGIDKLIDQKVEFTTDNLYVSVKEFNNEIEKDQIENLMNGEEGIDDDAVKFIVRNLKDYYIRNYANEEILKDVVIELKSNGKLDTEKVEEKLEALKQNVSLLYKDSALKTTKDLARDYKKVLQERRQGTKIRSLGFKSLNEKVTKPGEEKQISLLISSTGGCKSIMVKTIENNIANLGIPVLSLNPEMDATQTMDRVVCFREDLNIKDLMKGQTRRSIKRVNECLSGYEQMDNYLFSDETRLAISDVDHLITMAKNIFRKKGVFKNGDEYIFITLDLLSMLTDFEDNNYQKILDKMDLLHQVLRKHKTCHLLGVLQANDNKVRERVVKIDKPEDVQFLKIGLEDVKGGNSWNERARLIMTITRPVELKRRFFPERIEEWDLEEDVLNLHGIKQNEGGLFFSQFVFNPHNSRIYTYQKN